ncbi:winged helix-turn-helix domain-containing protein [Nonomuraea sp. NPDC050556]|uniref:winged helix-turn-helix domain-containing protein n=1 Tax=Nonomuraea sp. NPDC050556 TaxID=3364369 RepID=UPI0037A68C51
MSNVLSVADARRLAISAQRLDGRPAELWDVLRALRCLQLDPINVVARSHQLVLRSRLGAVDIDALLWEERSLFEYWAHAASIVLTEDYPIHRLMMSRYPRHEQAADFIAANSKLRAHILERLADGPLPAAGFDDLADVPWKSSGWTNDRNVERMLQFLWLQGKIVVAGRKGRARVWGLPSWPEGDDLPEAEVVRQAAGHAVRALGVARAGDIAVHFTRDRYPGLPDVLDGMVRAGELRRVRVEGRGDEEWYLHADASPGEVAPRTTLLSPFDNLLCDRARTELLWGFAFRTEMYVPKAKRQYGYYLMPILHGDQLVGRIAPRFDRKAGVLDVEGVYLERPIPFEAVTGAIEELATFVGARDVRYTGPVPW